MKTSNKILGIVTVLLFIGAGLTWQHSLKIIHQYRWIVLEEPVHLEDGFTLTHPFTVDVAAKYWIEIECHRTVSFDIIDQALTKDLKAECLVTQGTTTVVMGDSAHAFGSSGSTDAVSIILVRFDASPHTAYNLKLHIKGTLTSLASTRPEVKISVEGIVYKEAYVRAVLYAYFSLGLGIIGAACAVVLMIRILSSYLRRKKGNDA